MIHSFFTPANSALTICAVQGVVLAVILYVKKKGPSAANRILAGMVIYLSFSMMFHAVSHQNMLPMFYETHALIIAALSIIYGPALYFYVMALTRYDFKFKRGDFLHVLPALCGLAAALPASAAPFSTSVQIKMETAIVLTAFVSFAAYLIPAHLQLARYARMIRRAVSNTAKANLYWLRFFIVLLTSFWLMAAVAETFFSLKSWDIVWLISSLIIFTVSCLGLLQPAIFSGGPAAGKNREEKEKYRKSSLTPEVAERHLAALDSVMASERLYLDNELTLAKLADRMGIPLHHLSQVINDKQGMTFYDYINSRRIEEAKLRLQDPGFIHQNISAIGLDAGFNSISAFNKAFKKFTCQTPSQFRNNLPV
jgi:putative ABC transport system permease protein